MLIQNFSNFASLNIEMIKYQSTEDIWGFTWNGRRKDSDYDTLFALNDKVKVVNKDTSFSSIGNALVLDTEDTDQKGNLKADTTKTVRFTLDRSSRMKYYIRYPAYTVVQGLSKIGGLLAMLNVAGIICLFVH